MVRNECVKFSSISKVFDNRLVLDNVSFSVSEGETAVIIGPSGSGKSTLLRMVNMLELPSSGCVYVFGKKINQPKYSIRKLRTKIGMVFQHYSLFPQMNVIDNVAFPLQHVQGIGKNEARKKAMYYLDSVGIGRLATRYPDQISGGERQRAAIARSLTTKPRIMLFDEVTSALDPEHVKSILDLIAGLKDQGITMIVVTHEMRFARVSADKIIYLDKGHLLESGSSDQIFKNPRSKKLQDFLSVID